MSLKVAYSDDIQVVTKSLIHKTLQPYPPPLFFSTLFSFPYLILSFPHSIPHSRFTWSQPSLPIELAVPPIKLTVPSLAPSQRLSVAIGDQRQSRCLSITVGDRCWLRRLSVCWWSTPIATLRCWRRSQCLSVTIGDRHRSWHFSSVFQNKHHLKGKVSYLCPPFSMCFCFSFILVCLVSGGLLFWTQNKRLKLFYLLMSWAWFEQVLVWWGWGFLFIYFIWETN